MTTNPIITLANKATQGLSQLSLEERADLFQAAGEFLKGSESGDMATGISKEIRNHLHAQQEQRKLQEKLLETQHALEELEMVFIEMLSKSLENPPPLS